MKASVVIPTYERPESVVQTVRTVCDQTIDDYEVYLVDDGSESSEQADALDYVESTYGRVTVLREPNRGPAGARNRGWRAAESDVVLFTDDDCLVPNDWAEQLLGAFESGVGAVGGPLLPASDLVDRNPFAKVHAYRNQFVYEVPTEPTVGGDDLPMGGTANVAYLRQALVDVDGFDESFPVAAGEDADLQTRVVRAGYRTKYVPIVVEHDDEFTISSFASRSVRRGVGTYYYRKRHGGMRSRSRVLLGLLASPLYAIPYLLDCGELTPSTLLALERLLNRWGELKAVWNAS